MDRAKTEAEALRALEQSADQLPDVDKPFFWKKQCERVRGETQEALKQSDSARKESDAWRREFQRVREAGERSQRTDHTKSLKYSDRVREYLAAMTPFGVCGLYATALGGLWYRRKSLKRCDHIVQAAQSPLGSVDRHAHRILAWVEEHEMKDAVGRIKLIRARGIVVGLGAPTLWLAYLWSKRDA